MPPSKAPRRNETRPNEAFPNEVYLDPPTQTKAADTITQVVALLLREVTTTENLIASLRGALFAEGECQDDGGCDEGKLVSVEAGTIQALKRLNILNQSLKSLLSRV